jgi:biopolymer transport protein TolR
MLDTIFLIILLLLATLMHSSIVRGFPVNCPAFADRTTVQKEDNAIEVSIDRDGHIYIGKDQLDLAALGPRLQSAGNSQGNSGKVLVRGDDAASYGRVAHVLAAVSQALPGKEVILVTQTAADEAASEPEPNHEELEK